MSTEHTLAPRYHVRADGVPKRALTYRQAFDEQERLQALGQNVMAYYCPACGKHHIGKPRGEYVVQPYKKVESA